MTVTVLTVGELAVNCYLLRAGDGSGWIVDPGDEPHRILESVKKINFTPKAVVLTHAHFDHIGAAGAVCAALQIPLWIGAGDEQALRDPVRNLSALFGGQRIDSMRADRLLREGEALEQSGETLTVLETPGHTPGGICLVGDGLIFSGDTLFEASAGRTDFPGGNPAALRASLQKLASLPGDYTVYPGHGAATMLDTERRHNPFMP